MYPPDYSPETLVAYPQVSAARRAMDAGEISAYFVVPADYVEKGKLSLYMPEYNLVTSTARSQELVNLINYNLLGGDHALAWGIIQPIQKLDEINVSSQSSPSASVNDSPWVFGLAYGVMMLFFISIMGSSTLLLNSLTNEKENRVIEILMVSTSPRQLLLGKIAGLGLIGLFQMLIWAISSMVLLQLSGSSLNLPSELIMHPSFIAWGILFFILGYLVYASLMAGIGALVPNLREASQVTVLVMLPLMTPMILITALTNMPNGVLAVALSLFPLTAPTTMMMRIFFGHVPLWQLLLSVALLIATTLLVIRLVAGMFRAQTILSGQAFQIKRFFLALVGKV